MMDSKIPQQEGLEARFPSVHAAATLRISLYRTFRIPDDGEDYPLPPGLGTFPLVAVDDARGEIPELWREQGGFLMPMYQSEAMWLSFSAGSDPRSGETYPVAVKVLSGRINAITGEEDEGRLLGEPQNYCAVPEQPWLDGFCVEKGIIRQFVAMPLGEGYGVHEQLAGDTDDGGLTFEITPLKRTKFLEIAAQRRRAPLAHGATSDLMMCQSSPAMAMGAGGQMRQEIYEDEFAPGDYDTSATLRLRLHPCNSMAWRTITGSEPPYPPCTAEDYARSGLPWFEWYAERPAVAGGDKLTGVKSVAAVAEELGTKPFTSDASVPVGKVVPLGPGMAGPGSGTSAKG